jgi:hypothetical protein
MISDLDAEPICGGYTLSHSPFSIDVRRGEQLTHSNPLFAKGFRVSAVPLKIKNNL